MTSKEHLSKALEELGEAYHQCWESPTHHRQDRLQTAYQRVHELFDQRPAVETTAEPCSACADAHAQIGDFGIADGDIADRVGDLIERLCDCEISLGTFDPGAAAEYWLKYGTRAPEASPEKSGADPFSDLPVETT